jgi:hypothetical protein
MNTTDDPYINRAPSRAVWHIDTGKMRPDRASWVVNNFKNELTQKRMAIHQIPDSMLVQVFMAKFYE